MPEATPPSWAGEEEPEWSSSRAEEINNRSLMYKKDINKWDYYVDYFSNPRIRYLLSIVLIILGSLMLYILL